MALKKFNPSKWPQNAHVVKNIKQAISNAPVSSGKNCILKYLNGQGIGMKAAITAKCCECMGYYVDGKHDCGVSHCPLYPWMPYNGEHKRYVRPDRRNVETM